MRLVTPADFISLPPVEPIHCNCQKGESSRLYLQLEAHRIMRCDTCGGAWTDPRPQPVNYVENDFHGMLEASDSRALPWEWRMSLRTQLKMIIHHLPAGAHIHEVGCGQGLFLDLLRNHGFEVTGIEPSKSASNIARKKGLQVECGYFGHGNAVKKADCVVFSHVLEHIGAPYETLQLAAHIARGGHMMFFQTNYRGLIPRAVGAKWAWIPNEHFWHFTPNSLQSWLSKHEFTQMEVRFASLVQGNWKTKLLQLGTLIVPQLADGFISIFKDNRR